MRGHIIDADKIAHSALSKKSPVYKDIVSAFGKGILTKKKSVDRKKLAKEAFSKNKNLKKLCMIVHPFVISRIKIASQNPLILLTQDIALRLAATTFINPIKAVSLLVKAHNQ